MCTCTDTAMSNSNKLSVFFLHFLVVIVSCSFYTCATNTSLNIQPSSSRRWTGEHIESFQGQIYILAHQPKLSWENAWLACEAEGLTLARIETPEQLKFLLQLANTSDGGFGEAWVGGSRRNRSDDSYIWLETGEIVPSFMWSTGQPDRLNASGSLNCTESGSELDQECNVEDCVEVRTSFNGANDHQNRFKKPFICTTKLEDLVTTTTTTTTTTTENQATSDLTTKTPNPDPGFCTTPGVFPDPHDCQKYHLCQFNEVGDLWDWIHTCPEDLVWCQSSKNCQANDVCPCSLNI